MQQALIDFLNATAINAFIQQNAWVWPTMEMIHFAGLCMLLGSLLIIDLSVIGFARDIPLKIVDKFIIVTLIGFGLNAITGTLFFIGDPDRYAVNIAFRIKIVLIAIAGLNALYFTFRVRPKIEAGANNFRDLGTEARLSTALSLTLWTSIIVLGRFIPYVEDL
jgi:hypothetical protein